jgi:phosphoribosylglycinamide formyltransferase-1
MPRLLIFASGSQDGGGSGFAWLAWAARAGRLRAEIVGAVSQHPDGGTRRIAAECAIPFLHFPAPWDEARYRLVVESTCAGWCALSGWTKRAVGLDPRTTFNIHPAPLPRFGGQGMYGLQTHAAVLDSYRRGEILESELCMHFVTDTFDAGPVFFRQPVEIAPGDTPESLADRVRSAEHFWQATLTDLVVNGLVRWDGRDPASLVTPDWCLPKSSSIEKTAT